MLFLQRFFDDPFDALAANEQSIGFGQLLVVRDDLFDAVMPEFSFDVPMPASRYGSSVKTLFLPTLLIKFVP